MPRTKQVDCPHCGKCVAPAQTLTVRENKLLDNIASGKYQSIKDAAIAAGYAETTAGVKPYAKLATVSISKELDRRKVKRSDKARDLFERSKAKLSAMLEDDPSEELVIRVMQVSAAVLEKGIEHREKVDPETVRSQVGRLIRRVRDAALRCALDRPFHASRILCPPPPDANDADSNQVMNAQVIDD